MFKIIEERQNDLNRLKIQNTKTGEYISVIPQFGANINEIVLKKNNRLYNILDGNDNRAGFEGMGIFKNAKLLPFPNRIKNGRYIFNNTDYQLNINYKNEGNAAHGFIYDKPFALVSQSINDNEAQVTLKYDYDGSIKGYPFPLHVQYSYIMSSDTGFKCQTLVRNLAKTDIPFACGWHPFFSLNKKVDNLKLMFSADEHILFDAGRIPNGLTEKYIHFNSLATIGKQVFDACFKLTNSSDKHYTELFDEENNLKIILWQETGEAKYNYLQLYIPPSRESIAIEPMTSNVNAFNNHEGLINLKSGKKFTAQYGVQLK